MHDDMAIELIQNHDRAKHQEESARREATLQAQRKIDDARLTLVELAPTAVAVLTLRLMGAKVDPNGKVVDEERERSALAVLDRIGLGKIRMQSVRAALTFEPGTTLGDDPSGRGDGDEDQALDPASVDAQIDSFLAGVKAARDLSRDQREG